MNLLVFAAAVWVRLYAPGPPRLAPAPL